MWDETNFLLKGFIDEVKGALTKSDAVGSGSDIGFEMGSCSNGASALPEYSGSTASYNLADIDINGSFINAE